MSSKSSMKSSLRKSRRFPWRARELSSGAWRSAFFGFISSFMVSLMKFCTRLYSSLVSNSEWMDDLREADVIFVATHSQGSVVSTHLLNKLIDESIIYTRPDEVVVSGGEGFPTTVGLPQVLAVPSERKIQRVCCLALCGIHLGPLRYLSSSSLVAPYIQARLFFLSKCFLVPSSLTLGLSTSNPWPPVSFSTSRTPRVPYQERM